MRFPYYGIKLNLRLSDPYHRSLARCCIKRYLFRRRNVNPVLETAIALLHECDAPVIVDIGCNIGAFSLPMAKLLPDSRIYSVDPHPTCGHRFLENMRANNLANVEFISGAVATQQGVAKLFVNSENSGGHRLRGFDGRVDSTAQGSFYVGTIALEPLLSTLCIQHLDLLKIDAEGYEVEVLKSLGSYRRPDKVGAVIAEYGPEGLRSAGASGAEMFKLMADAGYKCCDLGTGEEIESADNIPELADFSVTDFLFTGR